MIECTADPHTPTDTAAIGDAGPAWVLFEHLRLAIESGQLRPGQKIMPIRGLAERFSVSYSVARTAVGRLERMRLVERRRGAGTFVTPYADRLAPVRAVARDSVVLMLHTRRHLQDRLAAELAALVQEDGRMPVTLSWRPGSPLDPVVRILGTWRDDPPRAVVVSWESPGQELDRTIAEACAGRSRIITTLRPRFEGGPAHSVGPDQYRAGELAAEQLIRRGHRRIGLVTYRRQTGPRERRTLRKRATPHSESILGAGHALRRAGIHGGLTVHYSERVEESTECWFGPNLDRLTEWLAAPDRPTAVLGSDFRMVGVVRAARRLGLTIPGDLEVMGTSGSPWSEALGFHAVDPQVERMAEEIVRLIRAGLPERDEPVHHVLVPPRLVRR